MYERALKLLLRANGAACLLALVAVFMPAGWMAAAHERLGLGPFPDRAIVVYLARSLSLLYAVMGGLFCLTAGDVKRHSAVIAYLAAALMAAGLAVFVTCLALSFPAFWTFGEGPISVADGAVILFLQRRASARN